MESINLLKTKITAIANAIRTVKGNSLGDKMTLDDMPKVIRTMEKGTNLQGLNTTKCFQAFTFGLQGEEGTSNG